MTTSKKMQARKGSRGSTTQGSLLQRLPDGFGAGDDQSPAKVLEEARRAAEGKDVRLGGGATTIRKFLDADLVDTMHIAVSDVELGSGVPLWESPEEMLDRFQLEVVPSPSGVRHHLFWRR